MRRRADAQSNDKASARLHSRYAPMTRYRNSSLLIVLPYGGGDSEACSFACSSRFIAIVILSIARVSVAQTISPTGVPSWTPFDSDSFTSVNLSDLSVHIEIPIRSLPARAPQLNVKLSADSNALGTPAPLDGPGSQFVRPGTPRHTFAGMPVIDDFVAYGGLGCVYANDASDKVESIDHNSNTGECGDHGGTCVPGYVDESWVHFNSNSGMFQVLSLDGDQIDYSTFEAGAKTREDGFCATATGCGAHADFSQVNAHWLTKQIVGKAGFSRIMQFIADREQPIDGLFGQSDPGLWMKLVSGPFPFGFADNWAGQGGMGAPKSKGDWAATVHDYNYSSNGLTIGNYWNPSISPAAAKALIQSNKNLIRNTGGAQAFKMGIYFGAVNAWQWFAHAW